MTTSISSGPAAHHATTGPTPEPVPAPRWAVLAAWAVPLCVLPSAVWRLTEAGDTGDPGYLVFLSVLSLALAFLTLGLVQRWGERFPARLVTTSAATGGGLLLAIYAYLALNKVFGFVERGPVLVGGDDVVREPPGWDVLGYYVPLVLWAPLVLAVTWNFHQRHRTTT